jgi:hypothetical protein
VRDDNEDVFDLSAYGMTRSGAAHGYICLQRHQDGMILFSGMDLSLCSDIFYTRTHLMCFLFFCLVLLTNFFSLVSSTRR